MKHANRVAKLEQIQQQAQLTLDEFPRSLTRERLRMIIALARQLRAELLEDAQPAFSSPPPLGSRSSFDEGC
jgi:hypothetical protein